MQQKRSWKLRLKNLRRQKHELLREGLRPDYFDSTCLPEMRKESGKEQEWSNKEILHEAPPRVPEKEVSDGKAQKEST